MKDRPIILATEHLRRTYDQLRGRQAALLADRKRFLDRIVEIDDALERMRNEAVSSTADEIALRPHYFHHSQVAEQHKQSLREGISRLEREHLAPLEAALRVVATKKAALEKLLERRRQERRRTELRRDQALMDEIAGRRAWRPR